MRRMSRRKHKSKSCRLCEMTTHSDLGRYNSERHLMQPSCLGATQEGTDLRTPAEWPWWAAATWWACWQRGSGACSLRCLGYRSTASGRFLYRACWITPPLARSQLSPDHGHQMALRQGRGRGQTPPSLRAGRVGVNTTSLLVSAGGGDLKVSPAMEMTGGDKVSAVVGGRKLTHSSR